MTDPTLIIEEVAENPQRATGPSENAVILREQAIIALCQIAVRNGLLFPTPPPPEG